MSGYKLKITPTEKSVRSPDGDLVRGVMFVGLSITAGEAHDGPVSIDVKLKCDSVDVEGKARFYFIHPKHGGRISVSKIITELGETIDL